MHNDQAQLNTWDEARRAWLAAKARSTARVYAAAWREFFAWARVPPWEASPKLAHAWAGRLRAAGLAPGTVRLKLSALSSFYDYVGRLAISPAPTHTPLPGWTAGQPNPFEGVGRSRPVVGRRARSLSREEVRAILAAVNPRRRTGARDYALLLTLLAAGRHVSRVLGLRWGDLEPLREGGFLFTYPGPDGAPRATVLPDRCYRAICAYLELDGRPPGQMAAGDYIFQAINPAHARWLPGHAGRPLEPNRPLSRSYANRILKKYARRAGVARNRANLHALRKVGRTVDW
jgi:integrase